MTMKIFRSSFIVGLCVLLVSAGLFLAVLYGYYENRVYDELSAQAQSIVHGVECAGEAYFDGFTSRDRVTWVAQDGQVLYDSGADASAMSNHRDREEISQALEKGSGKSSHYSQTLMQKTLYYALLAKDGTVVRVSCVQRSPASIVWGMLQPILWVLALTVLLSGILSSRLARKIVKPINELDLDYPEVSADYKELSPLVDRLREQNFTIRRQMDELGAKQREFSAITDNMSEGFIISDNRGAILSKNHAAARLLESGGELSGSVLQKDCPEPLRDCAASALAGRRAERMMSLSGRSLCLIASPVVASGQVTGAAIMIMDATEREQREQLRREFSANVSHELKTPLTSISGFAELMKEGLVPPDKMKEFAGDIYAESSRLIALVNDIIRLSGLDEDSPAFETEPVELYSLAQSVTERLESVAEKKNVSLRLTGGSAEISGVRQLLEEMIYNLCDNAIKYNVDGGRVDVNVKKTAEGAAVTVADTGIGIPYAEQGRVFERFYRVDKSHSKEVGGTGLGLSIVKHGAQYHNARVELESEPGRGTTVRLLFVTDGVGK